jgi:hypothetical protein
MFGTNLPKVYISLLKQNKILKLGSRDGNLDKDQPPVVKLILVDNPYNFTSDLRQQQAEDNLLYYLISQDLFAAKGYFPDGYFINTPYINRPFIHGLFDCYTLLQDWMYREKNIKLPFNINRPWEWWNSQQSLYLSYAEEIGFAPVSGNAQYGDVMVFALGSTIANHCAIYIEDGIVLHHRGGKFSCFEKLSDAFMAKLITVGRHKDG